MSETDDGAHLGYAAEDGMKAALGADQAETPHRTPTELRDELQADTGNTYSGTANQVALALVALMEERPELRSWPAEAEGAFFIKATGEQANQEQLRALQWDDLDYRKVDDRDLYAVVKEARPDLAEVFSGITGFQWGWAVNAAKYILGEPPVPNPAIVTVRA